MRRLQFNTGRLYTREGQRIIVGVDANAVRFWDDSRGIGGGFPLIGADDLTNLELQHAVMHAYDHGQIRYLGMSEVNDLQWQD